MLKDRCLTLTSTTGCRCDWWMWTGTLFSTLTRGLEMSLHLFATKGSLIVVLTSITVANCDVVMNCGMFGV